ncbi:MAG: hypothetical protein JWQ98_2240 [Chlorobi bacterium]|nr:hypothetical protein [Chlorobiota bacterium]
MSGDNHKPHRGNEGRKMEQMDLQLHANIDFKNQKAEDFPIDAEYQISTGPKTVRYILNEPNELCWDDIPDNATATEVIVRNTHIPLNKKDPTPLALASGKRVHAWFVLSENVRHPSGQLKRAYWLVIDDTVVIDQTALASHFLSDN